jgi:hypothetical protein
MRIKTVLSTGALSCLVTATAFAGAVRPGFSLHALPPNDDGYSPLTDIGFSVNFYGLTFGQLHVNNNGNITFDAPLSTYTPFDLTSTGRQIIAPFFADVDTRAAGSPVTYGAGSVDGRFAFGANWVDVDCYYSDVTHSVRNSFQVVLIDRSDTGAGNFDFELNYDQVQWETGEASGGNGDCLGGASARAGFSNGTREPGTFHEMPGSGVAGAFVDSGPAATALIHNRLNSTVLGRYVFRARNGTVVVCDSDVDGDGLCDDDDDCPHDPDNDLDGDGVCGDVDRCPGTVLPEQTVPSRVLLVNHWACTDGDSEFETVAPSDNPPEPSTFTLHDTAGCSCEQILVELGLGQGHGEFGCIRDVMEQWIRRVTPAPVSPAG